MMPLFQAGPGCAFDSQHIVHAELCGIGLGRLHPGPQTERLHDRGASSPVLGYGFSCFRFDQLGHLQILTRPLHPLCALLSAPLERPPPPGANTFGFWLFWLLQVLTCGLPCPVRLHGHWAFLALLRGFGPVVARPPSVFCRSARPVCAWPWWCCPIFCPIWKCARRWALSAIWARPFIIRPSPGATWPPRRKTCCTAA